MKKHILLTSIIALASLGFAGVIIAEGPVVNIDPHRHGNLAAAQQFIVDAFNKVDKAQAENGDQLKGHAQKAKEYLVLADEELRKAADVSNENRR